MAGKSGVITAFDGSVISQKAEIPLSGVSVIVSPKVTHAEYVRLNGHEVELELVLVAAIEKEKDNNGKVIFFSVIYHHSTGQMLVS